MTAALKEKVPYCTVLYRTVLYYTVLYCTVLYSTILYCTVLYIGNHSGNDYFGFITANFLEINNRGDSRINEGKRGGWGEKWEYLLKNNQIINSKTEAHSNPLWIVGERANMEWFYNLAVTKNCLWRHHLMTSSLDTTSGGRSRDACDRLPLLN